jgi:predicted nucleotidyltransferase
VPDRFARHRASDLIRAARADIGMSQAHLAEAVGMSQPNIAAIESGRRTPGPDVLERILRAADYRPSIAVETSARSIIDEGARHGVRGIRVFGSTARGTDHFTSDIDMLVRLDPNRSYFDIAAFQNAVEVLTGFPVDVVIDDDSRPAFLDDIESVPL